MTKSEETRRKIVWHLRHVWRFSEGGNSWQSFKALASELSEDVSVVKREVHRLSRMGAVRYSWMCDGDGMVAGAGYFLTLGWEEHEAGRTSDPPDDWSHLYE